MTQRETLKGGKEMVGNQRKVFSTQICLSIKGSTENNPTVYTEASTLHITCVFCVCTQNSNRSKLGFETHRAVNTSKIAVIRLYLRM